MLKLLQEPAIWVNDTPVPLSANIYGPRGTGSRLIPESSNSSHNFENQENSGDLHNVSSLNFPREDGDMSRLKPESLKSRLKAQNTLDRSLIEFDTSLLNTSDYFSAEFTRNKKTGRVYRLSSGNFCGLRQRCKIQCRPEYQTFLISVFKGFGIQMVCICAMSDVLDQPIRDRTSA